MTPFSHHTGVAAPLDRAHVNTDLIAPARFLLRSRSQGFSDALFADLRGNGDFVLDRDPFSKASILVAGDNFGCGSSREHAVWALIDYGFRAVIAPSFADIFYNNAIQNGLLAVPLPHEDVRRLSQDLLEEPGIEISLDLPDQGVAWKDCRLSFTIDAYRKDLLLRGLSEIDVTLEDADAIAAFEQARADTRPWLANPRAE